MKKNNFCAVNFAPFCHLEKSVHEKISLILISLLPQIAFLFATESFRALILIFVCIFASILTEFSFFNGKRKPVFLDFSTAILRGILTAFFLPESYPIFGAFLIVFLVGFLLKHFYGGFCDSWINCVALAVSAAFFLGSAFFPKSLLTFEHLQSANPSLYLIRAGEFSSKIFDSKITDFLNSWIFRFFGIRIPNGYVSLFWDSNSTIPAFRFNLLTIFSSIFLFSLGVFPILIPAIFFSVYVLLVFIFAPVFFGGDFFSGDIILATFSGGTLFCALYILQWFGTIPISQNGKIFFAIFAGAAMFFISGAGASPSGAIFAVLISDVFSVVVQFFEDKSEFLRLKNVLIPHYEKLKNEE